MSTDHVWWYIAMECDKSDMGCLSKWKTIHIAALIPSILSALASIIIIITGIVYHHKLKNLTFGAKLPIFISICDLLFEVFHGGDHLHNIIKGYVSENGLCQLFGSMKPFSINCQTAWALAIALYLNRTIFNGSKREPSFGKNNIYLHIFCWGIPTIILIFGFIFNVYGVEGPWCGINNPTTDIFMVDIWMVFTIIILIVNYSAIIYKLHSVTIIQKQHKNDIAHFSKRIKKVIRTIGLYPIAYFIQWLAYALYKTAIIPHTFSSAVCVVLTANMGGIFNLFLYGPLLLNQVKREERKNKHKKIPSTTNTIQQSKQSHKTNNSVLTLNVTSLKGNVSTDSYSSPKSGNIIIKIADQSDIEFHE
eukprot:786661_1